MCAWCSQLIIQNFGQDANAQNLGAEWARRNLDDDRTGGAAAVPMVGMPVPGSAWKPTANKPSSSQTEPTNLRK